MPTYLYECSCGQQSEVMASLAEKEKGLTIACQVCGRHMAQVFGNVFIASSARRRGVQPCCESGSCGCGNRKE
jgi:putative FmdB family regulatory protein